MVGPALIGLGSKSGSTGKSHKLRDRLFSAFSRPGQVIYNHVCRFCCALPFVWLFQEFTVGNEEFLTICAQLFLFMYVCVNEPSCNSPSAKSQNRKWWCTELPSKRDHTRHVETISENTIPFVGRAEFSPGRRYEAFFVAEFFPVRSIWECAEFWSRIFWADFQIFEAVSWQLSMLNGT